MSHFSENDILTPVQHGLRSKHSCESQLLITTDEFIQNFESKTQTDVVVLNFSKAFDVVPHLSVLQDWADRWDMCFNPSKCSVLRVSRPKTKNLEFDYTLKGKTLANVSSTPYLGVCLILARPGNRRPSLTKLQVKQIPLWASFRGTWRHGECLFLLVRSSLEYSSAVWDPFRQKYIDKLEEIQRSAARFVTQNYRQTASVASLIQNLS